MHDHESAWFSWALNWLTHQPGLVWYTPATSSRIINGLIAQFIDVGYLSENPIVQLERAGIFVQGLIVIISAIWFFWATKILGITILSRLFIAVVSLCIPTILIFAGHRGFYFELAILGVPFGLTLAAALDGNHRALKFSGIGCGFFLANYYPSAIIALTFIVTLGWMKFRITGWPGQKILTMSPDKSEWLLIFLISLCFMTWAGGAISFNQPNSLALSWISKTVLLACGLSVTFSYVTLILTRWIKDLARFSVWFFITFIAANFLLLPWYPFGLVMAEKKSLTIIDSLSQIVSTASDYPWFYLIALNLASLVLVLLLLTVKNMRKHFERHLPKNIIVFSLLGTIGVMLIGGATVTPDSIPGLAERGMIAAIPTLSVGWFVIFRLMNNHGRYICMGLLLVFCTFIVTDYYKTYSTQILRHKSDGTALDYVIDLFLRHNPNGRLVCVADEFSSKYCSAAYSYNRYRTTASTDLLPTRHLFNGRVVSLNARMPDQTGNWDDSIETVEQLLFPVTATTNKDLSNQSKFTNYVRANLDLKRAWEMSGEDIDAWGKQHWTNFGFRESRLITPGPFYGPLLVITNGGFFRDQLAGLLARKGMNFVPFWKWWIQYGAPNPPGVLDHSFFMDVGNENLSKKQLILSSDQQAIYSRIASQGDDIRNLHLAGKYLVNADLDGKILVGANLQRVDLRRASLINSNLSGADLTEADLSIASVLWSDLSETNLHNAAMQKINLYFSDLRGANLTDADLQGAKLWRVNMIGANLKGANLTDADLTKAIMNNSDLNGPVYCNTIMPNGILNNAGCN
jgi:uncharacterized protein YjbI with pentapeptide repeats